MSTIQLFNAPQFHYGGMRYRMNPPLGLPILAAVLQNAGHQVTVIDLEAMGISPNQFASSFTSQKGRWPGVMGFTCLTHTRRGVRECIGAARNIGYKGYILVGGPHMSLNAAETIEWGADCAVVGECEGNIANIVTEQPAGIVQGIAAPIEQIPAPLWAEHYPKPETYQGNEPHLAAPGGIAMWSRGCPHSCTFCGNPVFGHSKIRYAPPENVYRDMAALKERGIKAVFVYDDEMVGLNAEQGEWLKACCEKIAPLGLLWKCQGRCNAKTDASVYEAMYDAGCRVIMWGVESFSQPVLNTMHKGTDEADIWATLQAAHKAGIANWLFLMVGNYGETSIDLAYTEAQLLKAKDEGLVQYKQVTVCTPVQGTRLYDKAKSEGWLVEAPEAGPQMNQVYTGTPWLSAHELEFWHNRLRAL